MRSLQAALIGAAAALSLLVVHCGGGGSGGGESDASTPNDGSTSDATGRDASLDASGTDGSSDATSGEAGDASVGEAAEGDAADAPSTTDAADALGDVGNTLDGSTEAAVDGSTEAGLDGSTEAAPDAAQCQVDAGEGGSGCTGALSCCAGSCVDTTQDPNHCGACATACSAAQFCAASACTDAVLSNLCQNPHAAVVDDEFPADNDAGNAIATALTGCLPTAVTFTTIQQDNGTDFDQATHRPLIGPGTTLIAGGGAFGQLSVAYLDNAGISPAYIVEDVNTNALSIVQRSSGIAVVTGTLSSLTPTHDYFLLVMAVEPISGTLCFTAAGAGQGAGTAAAAYYFVNDIMPNLSTYTYSWYAYEWTSAGNDASSADIDAEPVTGVPPTAADTFALQYKGN
jgi:hypothetical protein